MDTAKENEPGNGNDGVDDSAAQGSDGAEQGSARDNVHQATAWLDDKLVPILGPAPLGPYELDERDDPDPGVSELLCPVCHHAMSRHETQVDSRTGHTYLVCPGLGAAYEVHTHEAHSGDEHGTIDGPVLS